MLLALSDLVYLRLTCRLSVVARSLGQTIQRKQIVQAELDAEVAALLAAQAQAEAEAAREKQQRAERNRKQREKRRQAAEAREQEKREAASNSQSASEGTPAKAVAGAAQVRWMRLGWPVVVGGGGGC